MSGVIPQPQLTPKQAAERRLIEAALAVRAASYDAYVELCNALNQMREYRRDLAIDGPTDNAVHIGAARGVTEIHRLVANASTLLAETQRRSG